MQLQYIEKTLLSKSLSWLHKTVPSLSRSLDLRRGGEASRGLLTAEEELQGIGVLPGAALITVLILFPQLSSSTLSLF